jgi:hypothetical protein
MNPSLVTRFDVISAMLSQIQQLPEWAEYCENANVGLTPDDKDYAINEMTFASIENAVGYFLAKSELISIEKAVEEAVIFFVANGKFADSVVSQEEIENDFEPVSFFISQQEFDEETESASTPSIWDLIDR